VGPDPILGAKHHLISGVLYNINYRPTTHRLGTINDHVQPTNKQPTTVNHGATGGRVPKEFGVGEGAAVQIVPQILTFLTYFPVT